MLPRRANSPPPLPGRTVADDVALLLAGKGRAGAHLLATGFTTRRVAFGTVAQPAGARRVRAVVANLAEAASRVRYAELQRCARAARARARRPPSPAPRFLPRPAPPSQTLPVAAAVVSFVLAKTLHDSDAEGVCARLINGQPPGATYVDDNNVVMPCNAYDDVLRDIVVGHVPSRKELGSLLFANAVAALVSDGQLAPDHLLPRPEAAMVTALDAVAMARSLPGNVRGAGQAITHYGSAMFESNLVVSAYR